MKEIKPEDVRRTIYDLNGIDVSADRRDRTLTDFRNLYYLICIRFCITSSYEQIGEVVGRSHSTVSIMSRRCLGFLETNMDEAKKLKHFYHLIVEKLTENNSYPVLKTDNLDSYKEFKTKRTTGKRNTNYYLITQLTKRVNNLEELLKTQNG